MSDSSTIDSLNTLASSIPDWNNRLDELNGQIALRQIELARLTEDRPATAKSVRNKGSTESLRPKDQDENPFISNDPDNTDNIQLESAKPNQSGFRAKQEPSSTTAATRDTTVTTPPPLPKASSNPKPSPSALNRQSSQPTPPAQSRISPAPIRKRKTESLASGESLAPKYRTRSMIIVYYDSAVQTAFEELVKFVSGSRNAIRKGKMAAKMAEMRRAAELEVEGDEEDDSKGQLGTSIKPFGESGIPRAAPEVDDGPDGYHDGVPNLRFVSTRNMVAPRNYIRAPEITGGSSLSFGYKRAGDTRVDVFDILDKGLEWCQSQCEHAAHQFLREGECTTEIANIKKKLGEVKETAEKEVERLKKDKTASPAKLSPRSPKEGGRGREFKTVQMRRITPPKELEVDDSLPMEVDDDEGVDDMEPQPALIFKRSRDMGR